MVDVGLGGDLFHRFIAESSDNFHRSKWFAIMAMIFVDGLTMFVGIRLDIQKDITVCVISLTLGFIVFYGTVELMFCYDTLPVKIK